LRIALKLATGAGKTTVMAMLIAWQAVNAARHPQLRFQLEQPEAPLPFPFPRHIRSLSFTD
jgi:hypothetical protein